MSRTKSVCRTIHDCFLAPHSKQRANDGNIRIEHVDNRLIVHPFEPGKARAPYEVHKYSFHLVICGVPHCHGLRFQPTSLLHEKTITQYARCFLNRKSFGVREGTHIAFPDHRSEVETCRGLFDDISVCVCIRAKLMVEMCNDYVIPGIAEDAHQA